jgi:hypothetical protein
VNQGRETKKKREERAKKREREKEREKEEATKGKKRERQRQRKPQKERERQTEETPKGKREDRQTEENPKERLQRDRREERKGESKRERRRQTTMHTYRTRLCVNELPSEHDSLCRMNTPVRCKGEVQEKHALRQRRLCLHFFLRFLLFFFALVVLCRFRFWQRKSVSGCGFRCGRCVCFFNGGLLLGHLRHGGKETLKARV